MSQSQSSLSRGKPPVPIVTEFALLKLRSDYDEYELYEAITQCLEIQDEWIQSHQPHLTRHKRDGNMSSVYITKPEKTNAEPPCLLIIAPWDSPEGHDEWIKSEENKTAMVDLQKFLAPGDGSVLLFHIKCAGKQKGLPPSFVDHVCFDVDRFFVDEGDESAVQTKYEKLERALLELKLEEHLWGGWRIEKDEETANELVVFSMRTQFPLEHAVERIGLSSKKQSYRFYHLG